MLRGDKVVLQRYGSVDNLAGNYVFLLGAYRALHPLPFLEIKVVVQPLRQQRVAPRRHRALHLRRPQALPPRPLLQRAARRHPGVGG